MSAPETKQFVSFVISVINAGGQIANDGHLTIRSAVKLFQALELAVPALKGVKGLPAELKGLSEADKEDLATMVDSGVSLPSGAATQVVDEALKAGLIVAEVLAQVL